jgi:hypothetical protein
MDPQTMLIHGETVGGNTPAIHFQAAQRKVLAVKKKASRPMAHSGVPPHLQLRVHLNNFFAKDKIYLCSIDHKRRRRVIFQPDCFAMSFRHNGTCSP